MPKYTCQQWRYFWKHCCFLPTSWTSRYPWFIALRQTVSFLPHQSDMAEFAISFGRSIFLQKSSFSVNGGFPENFFLPADSPTERLQSRPSRGEVSCFWRPFQWPEGRRLHKIWKRVKSINFKVSRSPFKVLCLDVRCMFVWPSVNKVTSWCMLCKAFVRRNEKLITKSYSTEKS